LLFCGVLEASFFLNVCMLYLCFEQDVDLLIDLLMEPWRSVRANWEEHARFLFKEFCGVHRVMQDATFANDEGVECSDTILVEMTRSATADCARRPLRLFQRLEEKGGGGGGGGGEMGGGGGGGAGAGGNNNNTTNTAKEPVCEAMNIKQFMDCLHTINPAITTQEVLSLHLLR
jgi:uncharacterized membrane protein YgcG